MLGHMDVKEYKDKIDSIGFERTWNEIIESHKKGTPSVPLEFFGEYYEIGLAHINKEEKKKLGIYYTPDDVANLLASFEEEMEYDTVADVGCGTGNLILAFLESIGEEKARKLLKENKIYLYDQDYLALNICVSCIEIKYGTRGVNCICGDFLKKSVFLPENCLAISNPPYSSIKELGNEWDITENVKKSKELYSIFMEKIIKQSKNAIIITPFSFIGGTQYYPLRKFLNSYGGEIFAFDNVPSSIFNRKKHGIFNTNTSNSVRTAITVVNQKDKGKGFKVSPLLRFNAEEREKILKKNVLRNYTCNTYQKVNEEETQYVKCFKSLYPIYETYMQKSNKCFSDLVSQNETPYSMTIASSGRYYLGGAKKDLDRAGKYKFYFKDEKEYYFAYAFINSSFAYFYWRIFDGNILYPKSLLNDSKVFIEAVSEEIYLKIKDIVKEMEKEETNYLSYKKNAGKMQENVKFPKKYRDKLNRLLLDALEIDTDEKVFDIVHSPKLFDTKKDS